MKITVCSRIFWVVGSRIVKRISELYDEDYSFCFRSAKMFKRLVEIYIWDNFLLSMLSPDYFSFQDSSQKTVNTATITPIRGSTYFYENSFVYVKDIPRSLVLAKVIVQLILTCAIMDIKLRASFIAAMQSLF